MQDNADTAAPENAESRTAWLTRNITADDLALVTDTDDEGWAPTDVIGPKGSIITVIRDEEDGFFYVEGFANDWSIAAWIMREDFTYTPPEFDGESVQHTDGTVT